MMVADKTFEVIFDSLSKFNDVYIVFTWYVTDLRRFNYNQIKTEKQWIVSLEFNATVIGPTLTAVHTKHWVLHKYD